MISMMNERREKEPYRGPFSNSSMPLACSIPLSPSEYRSLPVLTLRLVLLSLFMFILSDYAITVETVDSGLH